MSYAIAVREPQDVPFNLCPLPKSRKALVARPRGVELFSTSPSMRDVVLQKVSLDWNSGLAGAGIEQAKYVLNDNEFQYVTRVYQTGDTLALKEYLKRYPFIVRYLIDAYPHLRLCFGPDVPLVLQLVDEAEMAGHYELFGVVRTSTSVIEAMAAMLAFDEEWWLSVVAEANGRLNFTVEYS